MSWPLSHEFNEAIQNPKVAFADPDLRDGEPVVGATGLPLPRSGNFADVYQMHGADGRDWAVKCFTRPVTGLAERYARVSDALEKANLPFNVGFKFLAEGIRVAGVWRPVVKMEWVEGMLLNQVVREAAEKPATLGALGQMWVKLCKRLREAGIAHADLQHGNVLLVPGARAGAYGLKLIDYDGVWVPALANTPSGESGHPSFQHPARAATRNYSPDVDRFPHLVVATALRGLSVAGASLWEKYDNGDNLLFTEDDYKKPAESKAMRELWQLEQPAVQSLVGRLAIACIKPIPQTPWLDQLAPDGEPAPLDAPTRREAAAALGIALPVPVALPPEPAALPPEPAFVPAPARSPFAGVNEPEELPGEVDVELVEEGPKRKKPALAKRGAKSVRGAKKSGNGLIVAGGVAALLVFVGVVAAVVMSGGSKTKPDDSAQNQNKEEPEPVVPPKKGPNETPGPKPKEPPVVPPKKGPENTPVVWALKERWKQPLPEDWTQTHELRTSADSRTGQIWCSDNKYRVFDPNTGEVLKNPDGPSIMYGVYPLDGGRVVRPWHLPAGPVQVWDVRAGKEDTTLKRPLDGGLRIWLAPNYRCLAVEVNNTGTGKGQTRLVDTSTDKVLLDCDSFFGTVRFTADSSRALIWDGLGKCQWVKLPSGEVESTWNLADATEPLRMSAMSGDGSRVVFTSRNKYGFRLIDGRNGQLVRRLNSFPSESSLSHDGKLIFSRSANGSDAELAVADTGEVLTRVPLPPNTEETSLGIAPDVSAAFVAQPAGAGKFELVRYDITSGAPASPSAGPGVTAVKERFRIPLEFSPLAIQMAPDGRTLSVPHYNTRAVVVADLQAKNSQTLTTASNIPWDGVVPLTGGRIAVWSQGGKSLSITDATTGKPTGTIAMPDFPDGTPPHHRLITVSPDERYVLAGTRGEGKLNPDTKKLEFPATSVRVLDTKTGKNVLETDWTVGMSVSAAFSPDSSRVLLVDKSLRGRWYKLPSGELEKEWTLGDENAPRTHSHLRSITLDGRLLLCNGETDVGYRAFLADGETGRRLPLFGNELGGILGAALSADGRRAVLEYRKVLKPGTIQHDFVIVDTNTRVEVARVNLSASNNPVAALTPDGRSLVVCELHNRESLVVYDLTTGPGGATAGLPLTPPAVPAEMKAKWSVETNLKSTGAPVFTGNGQRIAVASVNVIPWGIVSFDARTGAAGPELPKLGGNSPRLMLPQDGPAIAYQSDQGRSVFVWDTSAEKVIRHAYPQPQGDPGFAPLVNVSPNGRYLAVSHHDPGPDERKERPLTPFQVIDTTTGQSVIKTDWRVGATSFTADSSRVLLVDATDRFQWYQLATGKFETEWTFKNAANGFNAGVRSISADGGVILFYGQPPERERAFYLLDGKTGGILHGFPAKRYHQGSGSVSDNGRFVSLVRNDGFGVGHTIEVLDARGNLFATFKLPKGVNPAVAVHWKTRTIALNDRAAATLAAYELPFDPNVVGGNAVAPPAVGGGDDPTEAALVGEPPALRSRWSSKVGDEKAFDRLLVTPEAVLLGSEKGFSALEPKTGVPRTVGFAVLSSSGVTDLFSLQNGRVGTFAPKATDVRVWNGTTGGLVTRHPVPELAPGNTNPVRALLAPNEKFLAVTRALPPAGNHPAVPLRVFEVATKKEQLGLDWKGGELHFTADSARVLVAEWTGKCQWFKMPSGGMDDEWDLGPAPVDKPHRITSASDDGAALGYTGPLAAKGSGNGSAVLNGKTGKPIRVFHKDYHPNSTVEVSADGKRAALLREVSRREVTVDVVELATGDRIGRARFVTDAGAGNTVVPLFAFAPDGRALVVYDPVRQRAHLFEVPATKAP